MNFTSAAAGSARPAAAVAGAGLLGSILRSRRDSQVADDWGVISALPVSRAEVTGAVRDLVRIGAGRSADERDRAALMPAAPRPLLVRPGGLIVEEVFSEDGRVVSERSSRRSATSDGASLDAFMAAAEADDAAERAARWATREAGAAAGGQAFYAAYAAADSQGIVSMPDDDEAGDLSASSGDVGSPQATATLDLVGSMLTNLLSNPLVMSSIQRELAADPAYHALLERARVSGDAGARAGPLLPPSADALLMLGGGLGGRPDAATRSGVGGQGGASAGHLPQATFQDVLDEMLRGLGELAAVVGRGFVHVGNVLRTLSESLREAFASGADASAASSPAPAASEVPAAGTSAAIAKLATAVAVIVLLRRIAPVALALA